MNILELSEIQQLLFSIDENTIEEIGSIIARSDYFENIDKQNLLFSSISLLIELRPKQSNSIIDLCILLNRMDPTNSFSIQLFKNLLNKLSQEHQYFIFKGYHYNLFPFYLISSSIEYLINSSQEKKAFILARWFSGELFQNNRLIFNTILSFSFLKSVESDLFKQKKFNNFLLHRRSSKIPTELQLFDILLKDDLESLKANIKLFSEIMMKKKHFFSIDSIYSQLTESSILLDENLSVFDICAYYNSVNCFDFLCDYVESLNKSKFLQSIYQERIKSFTVLHFAIAGGSIQIILSLINYHKFPIEGCIQCAIYFHRNDLIEFFSEIDTEIPRSPMLLLTSSKDVWGTPIFQSCHANNIEIFLQMVHYKSFQINLSLPYTGPKLLTSLQLPNPFFYNLNLYLYIYDNIIESRKALQSEDEKAKAESLFKFKNFDEAESSLSLLLSSIKFSKEMLINAMFYLCKKGYSELLELMIKELFKTSILTEKILSERPDHDHDDVFQFNFDLNITDQNGNSMLILASKFNQISCVKVLLNIEQILHDLSENEDENDNNYGEVRINAFNNERRSALEYACFNGNHEIVDLLLSTGRISIENLHKSLILCLRSYSYCNAQNFKGVILGQSNAHRLPLNIYNLIYPYSYVHRQCLSSERKSNKKGEIAFERIIRSIINAFKQTEKSSLLDSSSSNDVLSSSEDINSSSGEIKCQFPLNFSMYLKTIEKYSIENDNLEIFSSLMNCPEAHKSLSKERSIEIINNVIKHNSIKILKYIFARLEKSDKKKVHLCPIPINEKENFLKTAISSDSYDASEYLLNLGVYDLTYNDIFSALRYPEIIRLIYEKKPNLILSNINKQGSNCETILTESAINNFVNTFRFLHNLPTVNINAEGKEHDPICEAFRNNSDEIFIMCMRHPTLDMNKKSFKEKAAMEKVINIGDVISAKLILEKKPKLDITEQLFRVNLYNGYTYGSRTQSKIPDCLMAIAISLEQKGIVEYFNHYLAINNKKPYNPNASQGSPKKPELKEEDLNIEEAILTNNLESFKKLINKDTINMHFERNGFTPLNTAIMIEDIEIVKYLLSQPEIDVNLENEIRNFNNYTSFPRKTEYGIESYQSYSKSIGETPLITAIKVKNKEIVELLLAMPKIDVNKESSDKNWTPLIQAIKKKGNGVFGQVTKGQNKGWIVNTTKLSEEEKLADDANVQSIINLLINFDGIDINKSTKTYNPLIDAVAANQVETVKLMVKLFTDLPPDSKKTPLDVNKKGFYGKTAMGNARNEEIKQILRSKGAVDEPGPKFNQYTSPSSEPSKGKSNNEFPSQYLNNFDLKTKTTTASGRNPVGSFGSHSSNITNNQFEFLKDVNKQSWTGLPPNQPSSENPTNSFGTKQGPFKLNMTVTNPFAKTENQDNTNPSGFKYQTNNANDKATSSTNTTNTINAGFAGLNFFNSTNNNNNQSQSSNSPNNQNKLSSPTNTNTINAGFAGLSFFNSTNNNNNQFQSSNSPNNQNKLSSPTNTVNTGFSGFNFFNSTTTNNNNNNQSQSSNSPNNQNKLSSPNDTIVTKNSFDGNYGFANIKKPPVDFASSFQKSAESLSAHFENTTPSNEKNINIKPGEPYSFSHQNPSSDLGVSRWAAPVQTKNKSKPNGWGVPTNANEKLPEWGANKNQDKNLIKGTVWGSDFSKNQNKK